MKVSSGLIAIVVSALVAQTSAAGKLSYNRDVRPILADNCFACHGFDAKEREADLRLDTPEGAASKTEDGNFVIKPSSPTESELWKRIIATDPDDLMPPPESHKKLTATERETLRRWIEEGANYEKHWAFTAPTRPTLPSEFAGNPIDFFIAERLNKEGLTPAPEADKATLLRRVTLDLTGLPPTLDELDAFQSDPAPDAYGKAVDRLLTTTQYGERMATFWLDLARFGDTNGYLHDSLRTGWPWRDWVIKSFIDDKPFDQFVTEQLAGDLLPEATPDQILATAFSRNHPITAEGGTIAAEYLNEYAANRAETVGTAFLGLTMNCCRCHDHKFDPIKQEDFYGLLAFFNSTTEKHVVNNSAPAFPPMLEIASPLRPDGQKVNVMVMQEAAAPVPAFVLTRGQYDQPDENRPAPRKPPEALGKMLPDAPLNRLGLAQWIVAPENPMLARVTVNRFWQQFFMTGLVKTVDDFGLQGDFPSHPELLDWLAVEFREGGGEKWSTRHLVRLIVTSKTYRQSSKSRPELAEKDPENRLLARFPRQRLSAEEIRDQALFVAGLMSEEIGGAPVFPYQPAGLWEERSNEGSNTKSYTQSEGAALYRRSLYTFWKRTSPPPFMTLFDAPDRMACSVRRSPTNTPLQALAALNDEQMLECANSRLKTDIMQALQDHLFNINRRQMLKGVSGAGLGFLGSAALSQLMGATPATPSLSFPNFEPKAKRVIYLYQEGAPSQLDTFDYKPNLQAHYNQELPASIRGDQRLTGMTSGQNRLPIAPSILQFQKYANQQDGLWISDLLRHTGSMANEMCVVKSMVTKQINHGPGVTFMQTGNQIPGHPSMGAWLSYGLGSANQDLPSFVVMISQGRGQMQALFSHLWGSGYLPGEHQGVQFRAAADPVLFLNDPKGMRRSDRRKVLDMLAEMNHREAESSGDSEVLARIAQYEMSYRMQVSVPELSDFSDESEGTLAMYGPDVRKPGTYAYNCLMARRMAERGVRFIQLYHRGWDHHGSIVRDLPLQCQDVDRAQAALLKDLKQRGLLDETLVVWGGEFGRTVYCQGELSPTQYGRDHHPRCFSMWLAGGGIQGGITHGETDDFSYNVRRDPVTAHDLHATMLHCLGIEHTKLTYPSMGLDMKLTGVEPSRVVKEILT